MGPGGRAQLFPCVFPLQQAVSLELVGGAVESDVGSSLGGGVAAGALGVFCLAYVMASQARWGPRSVLIQV